MLNKIGLTAAALGMLMLAAPASAQTGQPQTQRVASITAEQAIEIAKQQGLVTVKEVDRDDGKWEVEGTDASGREIEVDIEISSGKVLKVDRD